MTTKMTDQQLREFGHSLLNDLTQVQKIFAPVSEKNREDLDSLRGRELEAAVAHIQMMLTLENTTS